MKITMKKTETIEVTPILLAEAFWGMDMQEQAEFFSHLFSIATKDDFQQQMLNCANIAGVDAKVIMAEIGKAAE